jgi:hypothetical protein
MRSPATSSHLVACWRLGQQWYTPCGSAGPPHQSGPECAVETKAEHLFGRIRTRSAALGLPRPTAILYWNSMFDFRCDCCRHHCRRRQQHSRACVRPSLTARGDAGCLLYSSMYAAHQRMIDLEAEGVHAFLRDDTGSVISLCNDGNVYCK